MGTFNFTWNNTFLKNYDVIVPVTGGTQVISREGAEQGSPAQGFPKWKAIGIVDWDGDAFGATLAGRYVHRILETDGNTLGSKFYTDLQLRWSPPILDRRFSLAVGANNLFNVKAPGCNTCDLNNLDPSVYDVPGRYYYVRLGVKY